MGFTQYENYPKRQFILFIFLTSGVLAKEDWITPLLFPSTLFFLNYNPPTHLPPGSHQLVLYIYEFILFHLFLCLF